MVLTYDGCCCCIFVSVICWLVLLCAGLCWYELAGVVESSLVLVYFRWCWCVLDGCVVVLVRGCL